MKIITTIIFIALFSVSCQAGEYEALAKVDQFVVYENEPVFIELIIRPKGENWIVDSSNQSTVDKPECGGIDEFTTFITANVPGLGVKTIGPYQFSIGNEKLTTNSLKIYKIAKKKNPSEFELLFKKDLNDTGLFHIKIEYKIQNMSKIAKPIEIAHKKLPKGVELKSSSSIVQNGVAVSDITVKKTANIDTLLNKENFNNIPDWVAFPEIILK